MKHLVCCSICAVAVLGATFVSGCKVEPSKVTIAPIPHIIILTPLSHPSLDSAIKGFEQGLSESGYGRDAVEIESMNAAGDFTKIDNLARSAISRKPNLIFVLTTPAASQTLKLSNEARIPLVYTAVTDPVSAGIVSRMEGSDTLATGVTDRYPVPQQVELFKTVFPNMRSAGILRNPAEQNSLILSKETAEQLQARQVAVETYAVTAANEIGNQTRRALADNDCIIVNGDNLIVQNLTEVVNLCIEAKKPLFVGDPDSVRKGAVCTVGPSYFAIGRQAGLKAAEVLRGGDIKSIPSENPRSFDVIINTSAARAMGLEVPGDMWAKYALWESKAETSS